MDFLKKALVAALMLLTINQSEAMGKFSRVTSAFRPAFRQGQIAARAFSPFRFSSLRSFSNPAFRSIGTRAPMRSFSQIGKKAMLGGLFASSCAFAGVKSARAEGALDQVKVLDPKAQAVNNRFPNLEKFPTIIVEQPEKTFNNRPSLTDVAKENESLKAKLAESETARKKLEDEKAQHDNNNEAIDSLLSGMRESYKKCVISAEEKLDEDRSNYWDPFAIYNERIQICDNSYNSQAKVLKALFNSK